MLENHEQSNEQKFMQTMDRWLYLENAMPVDKLQERLTEDVLVPNTEAIFDELSQMRRYIDSKVKKF